MVTDRISQPVFDSRFDLIRRVMRHTRFARAAVCVAVLAGVSANAQADGPPLILDSQRGINDGKPGVVLQNAPLGSQQMVPMQQLGGIAPPQQPYIVAPYVDASGGNGGNNGGGNNGNGGGNRPRPPHRHYSPKPYSQTPSAQQ